MNESTREDETVFVAGATGLTGRFLVQHLAALGIPVIAHVRPDSSRLQEWTDRFVGLGASVSCVDWHIDAMTRELQTLSPTLVFGLLGTTKKRTRGGDGDYEAVDYGLTACLIDACIRQSQQPRFVYLSAVGVKPDSSSAYYRARAKVEDKLAQSELRTLVARPSFILGDRDDSRPGERLGAPVVDALLSMVGLFAGRTRTAPYRSMTGDELAAGLVGAAIDWPEEGIVHVPELRAAALRVRERISCGHKEPQVAE